MMHPGAPKPSPSWLTRRPVEPSHERRTDTVPRAVYLIVLPSGLPSADVHSSAISAWAAARPAAAELRILTSTQKDAVAVADEVAAAAHAAPPSQRAQLTPLGTSGGASHSGSLFSMSWRADDETADGAGETPTSFMKQFGERVVNLVGRLEPVILEIEGSTQPVAVVAHEAACRTLRAFLLSRGSDMDEREQVDDSFPANAAKVHVLEFAPRAIGGFDETPHQV